MTVYVLPPRQPVDLPTFDVTTQGSTYRPLSPFLLGPIPLYGGMWSRNMENAWQYSKCYPGYQGAEYVPWARAGWESQRANRYPMGRGAVPLYSLWAGERYGYVTARKRIYIPLYAQAVRFHQWALLTSLKDIHDKGDIVIRDFDAYDHRARGYSWNDVVNDPERKMGHGFVLAMMIEGVL